MLSFLVSALTVIAMLLTLLSAGMLRFFTMRVPQGDAAMGLIVPLISSLLAGLAGLLALLCWAWRGGLDPLGWSRGQALLAALAAGLLLGLAIFGALIAWAEAPWARQPLLLNLVGLLLPLGAHALLLAANAQGIAALHTSAWGKGLMGLGAGALLAGAVCGLTMIGTQWLLSQRQHAAAILLAEMPAAQVQAQAWSPWLAEDARRTAADIRRHGLGRYGDDALAEQAVAAAAPQPRQQQAEQALLALRD